MGAETRLLLCVAAPRECQAVASAFRPEPVDTTPGVRSPLAAGVDLLATGVGPIAAAVSAGACLAGCGPSPVICLGVGGAYAGSGVDVLDIVLASHTIAADQGRLDDAGLTSLAEMGFPLFEGTDSPAPSPELASSLLAMADHHLPIATVGAASGSDAIARAVRARSGAAVEAMEGAAVHVACHRLGLAFAEVRVISNIVGDRARHPWRLDEALAMLGPLARQVSDALLT